MPGSVPVRKISGARSEALAEYLFGHGGPVLRGRDDSDYGVDLYCALANRVGERLTLPRQYTVQVKSTRAAWRFEDTTAVEWLVAHPSPLFLTIVDKETGTIDVFQTFARFDLCVHPQRPTSLVLRPGIPGQGTVGIWDGVTSTYDLGPPILRVTAVELFDDDVLADRIAVLAAWIEIERKNILLRDLGLLRFRGPGNYRTNELKFGAMIEKGLGQATEDQIERALHALGEALDCVGSQLGYTRAKSDPETLLLVMMLLRRLTDSGRKRLSVHDGIGVGALGHWIRRPEDRYVGETIDRVMNALFDHADTKLLLASIRAR